MDRKHTISPSKFTTYLACPLKYRWTYVDPRGRWYLRAKSYYSFGSTLHRVLERFHDSGDNGVETTHQALAAYDESWIDAGFASADEMADAYGEGKDIITRYVEEHAVPKAGVNTLSVEKLLRKDMGDFVLVGRLDRIDEHDDGTIEVIDYKSGRTSVTQADVASDIAMGCYKLLLKAQYPERRIVATITCLRDGAQASYEMSGEELSEFEFGIRELGRQILSHDYYELTPLYKNLCPTCDFLPICRKHPDFDDESADSSPANHMAEEVWAEHKDD